MNGFRSKEELDDVLQYAKELTDKEKEIRGSVTILSRAKEELVRRQSSMRYLIFSYDLEELF